MSAMQSVAASCKVSFRLCRLDVIKERTSDSDDPVGAHGDHGYLGATMILRSRFYQLVIS